MVHGWSFWVAWWCGVPHGLPPGPQGINVVLEKRERCQAITGRSPNKKAMFHAT
eukprot:m.84449 g.84449  ORF g.84449 m.84449 type:complete len:54 (-) comp17798_c0_seq4:233-394(-)